MRERTTSSRTPRGSDPESSTAEWNFLISKPPALLGLAAHPLDLEPTDHVGRGLSWREDVAVHLRAHDRLGHRRVRDHVVDGLLTTPPHGVQAGVDHQSAGSQGVGRQHAHPVDGRGVQPHLVGQALGVEAPTLGVRRVVVVLAELGDPLELGRDRQLQVMAGDALVVGQGLQLERPPGLGVGDVDEERAAPAPVRRRREVERLRPGGRGLDRAGRLRQHLEPGAHCGLRLRHRGDRRVDQLLRGLDVERGVGAQRLEDLVQVVGADHGRPQGAVLRGQGLDLAHPGLVDVERGPVGRRVEAQGAGVRVVSVGQPGESAPVIGSSVREHLVAQHVPVRRHRGSHARLQDLEHLGLPGIRVDPVRQ